MEPTPIEYAAIRPLNDLSGLRLSRSKDGHYIAEWDDQSRAIRVTSCFPWTAPTTFLSLRDIDGNEVALVPSIDDLDPESRRVLERALREATFAFEVLRVERVRLEFELRHWEVVCTEGKRVFQTMADNYPHILAPNGLVITDVHGDVYTVSDWTTLDRHSRKELAVYID